MFSSSRAFWCYSSLVDGVNISAICKAIGNVTIVRSYMPKNLDCDGNVVCEL